ncbi:hypothetical protein BJ875DRAFT_478797 [Amylocarpus encephaloides]|uniref:F-box domain-containing protein n=1 Tax=Amylocarpus encephaloides TaxID=45428 RepID=A0A9P7Y5U4_9HELO|nr:hypothetical protein BJ875DRAFT_478797 [Amylocarpus encephaloides]
MEESNPELEAFRQKWRDEVSSRTQEATKAAIEGRSKGPQKPTPTPHIAASYLVKTQDPAEENDGFPGIATRGGSVRPDRDPGPSNEGAKEPESALEHYERAVERENQGSLGDSLNLYRKAFRMDHAVDKKFKNKHFPPSSFLPKPTNVSHSNGSVTVPHTAHHSLDGPPQTITELIASFSGMSIESAPPLIEGTPAPPCPIAALPHEIMVHVLMELAILDVAAFVRLAQVCKKLAYMALTEEQIWKRVCIGDEVGFGGMHYQWQQEVLGGPLELGLPEVQSLPINENGHEDEDEHEDETKILALPLSREETTEKLLASAYDSSWQRMFRLRPRIRFNGCYISTVNYIRAGQASVSQLTWQSPVHIVTYYRYLRFFRDGTAISLLTTDEPADVVHHLTKELQDTHRGGSHLHLPSSVMQMSLRGRWRLSNTADDPEADLKDAEGDVFVETEGASKKYMYRMQLSLRNAGKGARNNKLAWQGFWNYNMLTDDTGAFPLRNNKAFFFSRVKSYGSGA